MVKTTGGKSGCALGGGLVQLRSSWPGNVDWMGEPWEQKGDAEDFVEGVEEQLLGEGHSSMRGDQKWQSRLAQVVEEGD